MKFETDVLGRANYAEERKNHATTRKVAPGRARPPPPLPPFPSPVGGIQAPVAHLLNYNAFQVVILFLAPLL